MRVLRRGRKALSLGIIDRREQLIALSFSVDVPSCLHSRHYSKFNDLDLYFTREEIIDKVRERKYVSAESL
jgi:hypothetical protein